MPTVPCNVDTGRREGYFDCQRWLWVGPSNRTDIVNGDIPWKIYIPDLKRVVSLIEPNMQHVIQS